MLLCGEKPWSVCSSPDTAFTIRLRASVCVCVYPEHYSFFRACLLRLSRIVIETDPCFYYANGTYSNTLLVKSLESL